MPVKGHQADIQTVDDDAQHGPVRCPFNYLQVFFTHPDRITKAGQGHKTDQFHQEPDTIGGPQQMPMVAFGYPDHFIDKLTGQDQRGGFAEPLGDVVFFF